MAMLTEDISLTAPGYRIYSTDSNNLDASSPVQYSGTSMATPVVTGTLGLVQEAFPYMSAKQLGDVALSTTVPLNIDTVKPTYSFLSMSVLGAPYGLNLICYDDRAKPTTQEAWKALIIEATDWTEERYRKNLGPENLMNLLKSDGTLDLSRVYFYNNIPLSVVSGQGLLNADRATNGLGALNAKRLVSSDIDTRYASGCGGSQALYSIDTKGVNSKWANDIIETRVLMPGMGVDQDTDLYNRQNFYRQYAAEQVLHGDPLRANKVAEVNTYISKYNAELAANPLLGLHVGLLKTGSGILRLTGSNSFLGAAISGGGVLQIDGVVAGDAYALVENRGTLEGGDTAAATSLLVNGYANAFSGSVLSGSGLVAGNVYNSGTLLPGSFAVNSLWDVAPQFSVGTLNIGGNYNGNGAIAIAVDAQNNANSSITASSQVNLTGSKVVPVAGFYPLPGNTYNYLSAGTGIVGNITDNRVSSAITIKGSTIGNTGFFTAQSSGLAAAASLDAEQRSLLSSLDSAAMKSYESGVLTDAGKELLPLYYSGDSVLGRAGKEFRAIERASLLVNNPLSTISAGTVADRLDMPLYEGTMTTAVPINMADGQMRQAEVSSPFTLDADNNFWMKLLRGFEDYEGSGDANDIGSKTLGGVIGYDRAVNSLTRVGVFGGYGKTDYEAGLIQGNSNDWRLGIYSGHDNGTWKLQGMLSYGQNAYKFDRRDIFGTYHSDYSAGVWDVFAKAKYWPMEYRARKFSVVPYLGMSYTYLKQGAYAEQGGALAQRMGAASNSSLRAEAGFEWKQKLEGTACWGGSLGYKRVLRGANPELNGGFVFDADTGFTLREENDRDYLTYSLNVQVRTGNRWSLLGEIRGEKSAHSHNEVYSVMAKYAF